MYLIPSCIFISYFQIFPHLHLVLSFLPGTSTYFSQVPNAVLEGVWTHSAENLQAVPVDIPCFSLWFVPAYQSMAHFRTSPLNTKLDKILISVDMTLVSTSEEKIYFPLHVYGYVGFYLLAHFIWRTSETISTQLHPVTSYRPPKSAILRHLDLIQLEILQKKREKNQRVLGGGKKMLGLGAIVISILFRSLKNVMSLWSKSSSFSKGVRFQFKRFGFFFFSFQLKAIYPQN